MIKLSPQWKQRKNAIIKSARTWKSVARKRAVAGLVPATTAAVLALASAAFVSSPAPSASRPARVTASAQAKVSVPPPLKAALKTLVQDFVPTAGTFDETFWRQAVAMSAMEAYRQTTGDATYDYTFDGISHLQPARNFEDNFNDDTAWWGLAFLQGYSITGYPWYLQNAEDIADYIHQTWNTTQCGGPPGSGLPPGGLPWERSGPDSGFSGAIQNGLFLELTAWLHNTIVEKGGKDSATNPDSYISWALQEWQYFLQSHLFHTNAITVPGTAGGTVIQPYVVPNSSPILAKSTKCGDGIKYNIYTYNQGVLIAGLAQLYKATGTLTYLTDAEDIANAVLKPPTPDQVDNAFTESKANIFTYNGVLLEPQDPIYSTTCCLGDGAAFKGIFVRDLRMLRDTIASAAKEDKKANQCTGATYDGKSYNQCTDMYDDFFTRQACSIEANDTLNVYENVITPESVSFQNNAWLGDHWSGPNEPVSITTQVSGVEAFVAAVNLPGHPFPDCHATQRSSEQAGQQRQHGRPGHTQQAAERCDEGWYRMPGCREEHAFGPYPGPLRRGQFFPARYELFGRVGDWHQN